MNTQFRDALIETLKSGIVVRALIDKRLEEGRGKIFVAHVHIELLVRRPEGGVLRLKYFSVIPRLRFIAKPATEPLAEFTLSDAGSEIGWLAIEQAWRDRSGAWYGSEPYAGEMISPTSDGDLHANHPRLLQELTVFQGLIGDAIRRRGRTRRDLIRAYVQLGHFIEDQVQIWDPILGP